MRGAAWISLFVVTYPALGDEVAVGRPGSSSIDTFTNTFADKFFGRALTATPLQGVGLDGTAVGKSGQVSSLGKAGQISALAKPGYVATPNRMRLRPLQASAQPLTRYASAAPATGDIMRFTREVKPGRLVQVGAEGFGEGAKADEPKDSTPANEVILYEGPPAISDALLPSLAIPTIVGLIPATAAWSRQAWVRFKITNIGITVNAGFGGKDVEEFKLSDVRRFRSVKRLFGDGDLIFTLKQLVGKESKFVELRNVPNYDEVRDGILKYLDPEVVEEWRNVGNMGER